MSEGDIKIEGFNVLEGWNMYICSQYKKLEFFFFFKQLFNNTPGYLGHTEPETSIEKRRKLRLKKFGDKPKVNFSSPLSRLTHICHFLLSTICFFPIFYFHTFSKKANRDEKVNKKRRIFFVVSIN